MSWILLKQFVFRKLQTEKLFSCKAFSWKAFVFKYLNYIKKVIILKNWIILIQHPISLFFGGFFFLLKADLCFQVCSYIKQVYSLSDFNGIWSSKGIRMVGVGDSGMECGTKKVEKQYRIFETFFTNSASKVEFLSTELFWS